MKIQPPFCTGEVFLEIISKLLTIIVWPWCLLKFILLKPFLFLPNWILFCSKLWLYNFWQPLSGLIAEVNSDPEALSKWISLFQACTVWSFWNETSFSSPLPGRLIWEINLNPLGGVTTIVWLKIGSVKVVSRFFILNNFVTLITFYCIVILSLMQWPFHIFGSNPVNGMFSQVYQILFLLSVFYSQYRINLIAFCWGWKQMHDCGLCVVVSA